MVEYIKITWKLEVYPCRKIIKTFIKQNVFLRILFLEDERSLYQCIEKLFLYETLSATPRTTESLILEIERFSSHLLHASEV